MVATTLCLAWAVVEALSGAVMWAIIFGAAGLYLAWQFFCRTGALAGGDSPAISRRERTRREQ